MHLPVFPILSCIGPAQQPPSFLPMSIVAKWLPISSTAEHLCTVISETILSDTTNFGKISRRWKALHDTVRIHTHTYIWTCLPLQHWNHQLHSLALFLCWNHRYPTMQCSALLLKVTTTTTLAINLQLPDLSLLQLNQQLIY